MNQYYTTQTAIAMPGDVATFNPAEVSHKSHLARYAAVKLPGLVAEVYAGDPIVVVGAMDLATVDHEMTITALVETAPVADYVEALANEWLAVGAAGWATDGPTIRSFVEWLRK